MHKLALFHSLRGQSCLVVGGGSVALRRTEKLLQAGAKVDLIAIDVLPELYALQQQYGDSNQQVDSARLSILQQPVMLAELSSEYACLLAATNDGALNADLQQFAKTHAIPCNRADNPAASDFVFPAMIEQDGLSIAITHAEGLPSLSQVLKQQISAFIPAGHQRLAAFIAGYRQQINAQRPSIRRRLWQQLLQGALADQVYANRLQQAEQTMQQALAKPEEFLACGEVYLLGAGPGDPELLTVKALRLLQRAEVVLYDRLVSKAILALIPDNAATLYVGKQRSQHAVPQDEINHRLAELALAGKRVVRLKGGDPFIFGRGGEELSTLVERQVPFQVVPGISAANGCASYAGIPLTHRDYAQSVQFITAQLVDGKLDLPWSSLVLPGKTLVFYMGLKTLPLICQGLRQAGMSEDMPVALVAKGTTPEQKLLRSDIANIQSAPELSKLSSPTLCIVGEVVQLAEHLHWFAGAE